MTDSLYDSTIAFGPSDFNVFAIPGLAPRMEALIGTVRPKLTALGAALAPDLAALSGGEMFPHVAKHARRTVHPPNDTWVAWAANKRGYKMLPHFQVGLFESHLFAQFAIIYECENKSVFAEALLRERDRVRGIVPASFVWSTDHMKPGGTPHGEMTDDAFSALAAKLAGTKQSEALVGIRIGRDDPLLRDGAKLYETLRGTFETLMPLYRMAF